MPEDDAGASPTTPEDELAASGETETTTDEGGENEAVPTTDEVTEYTTDVRTVSSRIQVHWGVRVLVGLAVLAAFARFALVRAAPAVDPQVVVAAAGALAVLGLVWVHLRYRAWSYELRADALTLERGVLTQVTTVAPHVRVQHVDTRRSPLERTLGLSTLVVYTAGSRGADVSIPGLTPGEASDLQRRLKELAIETEGGDAL